MNPLLLPLLIGFAAAPETQTSNEGKFLTERGFLQTLFYLVGKILGFGVLGYVLGYLGAALQQSTLVEVTIQSFVGVFIVATSLNMMQAHSFFKYFNFRFSQKFAPSESLVSASLAGLRSTFGPLPATQAMAIYVIGLVTPVEGARVMLAFSVGLAVFLFFHRFGFGRLMDMFSGYLYAGACIGLFVLGLKAFDHSLILANAPFTLSRFWMTMTGF